MQLTGDTRNISKRCKLQHYNPVIDDAVREMFHLPDSYKLVAQMPFGGIAELPGPKDPEDISKRVFFEE